MIAAPHETAVRGVILAGGEGTRLRPLTLGTPKPVVPIVDRPLLQHQLDLLGTVGVRQLVFSVAYKPERVQAIFGDGSGAGRKIHYAVEETPLGTGGAVRNALPYLDDVTVVFNGDILADVDLPAVVERHKRSGAAATLVLTPVPNPAAFGLVETEPDGRVRRFVEKPDPSQITTDTINAGIYVLSTPSLSLIPPAVNYSIERGFFPALIARGDLVMAHVHRGYWIDIGTPQKYLQVHRDILAGRFPVALEGRASRGGIVHASASLDPQANCQGPFYVGPNCTVAARATLGSGSVLVSSVRLAAGAEVLDSVLWEGVSVEAEARVEGALLGASVRVGANAQVGTGTVLGEGSTLSAFSRTA
jgi:NDP-sugar pyrophosphorylase family protein